MDQTKHHTTRYDCEIVIGQLIKLCRDIGLEGTAGLLVYGSYFGTWRDGVSDLDGMLHLPTLPLDNDRLATFQSGIRRLYSQPEFSWLEAENFFGDLFIIDGFFAADGRFLIFDRGFIERMLLGREADQTVHLKTDTKHSVVWGEDFVRKLKPVALRHQDEFELAQGLHRLWNYLLFEIPKATGYCDVPLALQAVRFLKVLPRNVAIILREPMARTPQELGRLRSYLGEIDYGPLCRLWDAKTDPSDLERLVVSWHENGNTDFRDCLACYEQTLAAIVRHEPMRSRQED